MTLSVVGVTSKSASNDVKNGIAEKIIESGRATKNDFPQHFAERCVKLDRIDDIKHWFTESAREASRELGDIMVQKAPACTIDVLANAVKKLFNADNEIKIIGVRHGEKLYETLLTREEFVKADDMGGFYRIPADTRDLNYNKYFEKGEAKLASIEEYNSNNTKQLSVDEVVDILKKLPYINSELA